ncbi:MAG: hypothetical protein FWF44_03985 [Defluviitaleaceae bacterium]|nr:hypothetical protein [Defluviitaleaceae bacterium]
MLEKLHILICVIAALIVLIVGIAVNMSPVGIAFRLIIAISVFYILGLAVKSYLVGKVLAPKGEGGKAKREPDKEPELAAENKNGE